MAYAGRILFVGRFRQTTAVHNREYNHFFDVLFILVVTSV